MSRDKKPPGVRITQRMQGNEPTCFPTVISMLGYDAKRLTEEARGKNGFTQGRVRQVMRDLGAQRVQDPSKLRKERHTLASIWVGRGHNQGLHQVMVDADGKYRNPWYPFGIPGGRRILSRLLGKGKVYDMYQVDHSAPQKDAPLPRRKLFGLFK